MTNKNTIPEEIKNKEKIIEDIDDFIFAEEYSGPSER